MRKFFQKNYYYVIQGTEKYLYICIANNSVQKSSIMKKVVNVGIGGRSFVMDNDAYAKLDNYLELFRKGTRMGIQTKEVMDDLEDRIAELFTESLGSFKDVVDIELVNRVIAQLGMPDGEPFRDEDGASTSAGGQFSEGYQSSSECSQSSGSSQPSGSGQSSEESQTQFRNRPRKYYRDPENKSIGGVCAGLALYLNLDVALIRVLFVLCFFMGSASFWIYVILWLVAPKAVTAAQKCEMYDMPVTVENMRKFSNGK